MNIKLWKWTNSLMRFEFKLAFQRFAQNKWWERIENCIYKKERYNNDVHWMNAWNSTWKTHKVFVTIFSFEFYTNWMQTTSLKLLFFCNSFLSLLGARNKLVGKKTDEQP